MQNKEFHIGDVLSIHTGYLVSLNWMDGVYDILNYMTEDELFTHQLPRAMREVQPYLREQLPWLAEVTVPEDREKENWWVEWRDELGKKYGEWFVLQPMHPEDHEVIGPVEEYVRMKGYSPEEAANHIIVLNLDEDEPDTAGDIDWKVE